MKPLAWRLLPLVLFLGALAVRAPTLGLPLEGASAGLASAADRLGREGRPPSESAAPVLPVIASLLVASGVPATPAVRWVDALLAALLAPLLAGLMRQLGAGRRAAAWGGLLMAVHPLLLVQAGGLAPGTATVGAVLLLLGLRGLLRGGPWATRAAALAAIALPLADVRGWIYAPLLLAAAVGRESSARARIALAIPALAVLLAAPARPTALVAGLDFGGRAAGAAALWLLVAGLGALWLGVARGWRALEEPARRIVGAWSAVAAFDFLLLAGRWGGAGAVSPWDTAADAAMLLPLVLVLGVRGLAGGLDRRRRVVVRATAGFALAASAALAWGGVQLALSPGAPGTAGRLRLLRDAMAEAAAVAGEDGWIVLAVGAGRPDEQASLADLQPDHWTWTQAPAEAAAKGAGRALLPFPAASFQAGHSVAVVAEAGSTGAIQTFDGAGIYRQELVGQHGPYVVLRAQRPDGAGAASDR